MRRSIVLSLPLQLVFPVPTNPCSKLAGANAINRFIVTISTVVCNKLVRSGPSLPLKCSKPYLQMLDQGKSMCNLVKQTILGV